MSLTPPTRAQLVDGSEIKPSTILGTKVLFDEGRISDVCQTNALPDLGLQRGLSPPDIPKYLLASCRRALFYRRTKRSTYLEIGERGKMVLLQFSHGIVVGLSA